MVARSIKEGLDDDDGLVSRWIKKNLDPSERAQFFSRLNQIRNSSTENTNWLKRYNSLRMYEVRVKPSGRIVRVLSDMCGDALIMLHPVFKQGKISAADESRASSLRDKLRKGQLRVREFPRA